MVEICASAPARKNTLVQLESPVPYAYRAGHSVNVKLMVPSFQNVVPASDQEMGIRRWRKKRRPRRKDREVSHCKDRQTILCLRNAIKRIKYIRRRNKRKISRGRYVCTYFAMRRTTTLDLSHSPYVLR